MTPESSSADSPSMGAASASSSFFNTIFLGPNGIRAGWRLLIFLLIVYVVGRAANFGIAHTPTISDWLKSQPKGTITAYSQIFGEGLSFLLLWFVVWIMSLIEKRSFADFGLPLVGAFGKRFWQGVPYGFAMLTVLLAAIGALHGFALGGLEIGGVEALKYACLFGVGFILVGLFEEFSFRGYLQATLGSGIGFWPSAIVLSIIFGAVHLGNPGEAKIGAFMAGSFGLLAAFALRRTGNLWFPIGIHAGWDWGETYFYGTPDSGLLAQGRLFNSSFHGPNWLTGGSVGPEGSHLVFAILVLGAAGIHFLFPAKREVA